MSVLPVGASALTWFSPQTVSYQELIAGEVVSERFPDWRQLLKLFGRDAFQRVGVAVRGEVEAHARPRQG